MSGYQDLIDWCNASALPNNRRTGVSVNLYEAAAPGEPAQAAWVGTLDSTPPVVANTFELNGSLQPLEPKFGDVSLHIVIDVQQQRATSTTIQGHKIKSEWNTSQPVFVVNTGDYHQDAVISGKIEIFGESMLYPIILGPTYTYHPPTTP
jgi:hypothetical protein